MYLKKITLLILLAFLFENTSKAQIKSNTQDTGGFAWGFKGGLTVGTQKWNGADRSPLFRYHGVAFIESASNEKSAFYAQVGYHIRGSATRFGPYFDPFTGTYRSGFSNGYQFRNASLSVGVKQKFEYKENLKYFYGFGLRGEYTINTNLEKGTIVSGFFPVDDPNTVRRFNGGLDLIGGFEMKFSESIGGILQITLSPDVTRQYFELAKLNVTDPYNPGQRVTIPAQEIKNFSLEVSLGLRFLRKVIYVD